jgi:hypothetical protein
VVGLLIWKIPGITFKPELRVDNLITLLLSIVLFVVVQILLRQQSEMAQRNSADDRREKDLIIRLLEAALNTAEELNSVYLGCHDQRPLDPENASRIKNALLRYNNAVHTVETALKLAGIENIGFDHIDGERSAYRDILTDDPFPAGFREGIYREQQGHDKKVKDTIIAVILAVNKFCNGKNGVRA